ncbi:MAG TPA: 2-C-methyl-D-erythritol 2,4-cyclodiphosphate synthase [Clostridiaceae bacterium]|nr:2-C-methyl-D-erythritol 2,4-cyclodiphosphate synthase [Clostridiaceae bacterium]
MSNKSEQRGYSIQAIGQDSHRFVETDDPKVLVLGGVEIKDCSGLAGNSDADVLLHALTNAISGITCKPILGTIADELCLNHGITDSQVYLELALADLEDLNYEILHISFTVQARRPKLLPLIPKIRESIAQITELDSEQVMITATSGEGLTDVGRGEGIEAFCVISVAPQQLNDNDLVGSKSE